MPLYRVRLKRESMIELIIEETTEVEVKARNVTQAREKALESVTDKTPWHHSGSRTQPETPLGVTVFSVNSIHHEGDGDGSTT